MASLLDKAIRRLRPDLLEDDPRVGKPLFGFGRPATPAPAQPAPAGGPLMRGVSRPNVSDLAASLVAGQMPAGAGAPPAEPPRADTPVAPVPGPGEPAHPGDARRAVFGNVAIQLVDSLDLPPEGHAILRQSISNTLEKPTSGEPNPPEDMGILERLAGLNAVPGVEALSKEQRQGFVSSMLLTAGLAALGSDTSIWEALLMGRLMTQEEAARTAGELVDARESQEFWGRINSIAPLPENAAYDDVIANLRSKLKLAVEAAGRGVQGAAGAVDLFNQQIKDAQAAHEAGLDRQAEIAAREDEQAFAAEQAAMGREFEAAEAAKARSFQAGQAAAARSFEREQAAAEAAAEQATQELDLTEAQSKTFVFANRAINAEKNLQSIDLSALDRASGLLPGFLESADLQRFRQAGEEFVTAIRRQESGAEVPPAEMESGLNTYWPQVGDSEEVLQQKADARRVAIESLTATLPGAAISRIGSIQAGGAAPALAAPTGADLDAAVDELFPGLGR